MDAYRGLADGRRRGPQHRVRLGGVSSEGEDAEFATSGRVITFPGFLRAYVEGSDDPDAELEDREVRLPPLAVGDALSVRGSGRPGPRHPAPGALHRSLVGQCAGGHGSGPPSTYATILDTIQNRGYVWKKGSALVPSWTAFAVIGLLERHFGELVDYGFTASMEEDLDEIATGRPGVGAVADPLLLRQRWRQTTRASSGWCRSTSARSTPARSTRSRSVVTTRAWWCGSVATGRTCSAGRPASVGPGGPRS